MRALLQGLQTVAVLRSTSYPLVAAEPSVANAKQRLPNGVEIGETNQEGRNSCYDIVIRFSSNSGDSNIAENSRHLFSKYRIRVCFRLMPSTQCGGCRQLHILGISPGILAYLPHDFWGPRRYPEKLPGEAKPSHGKGNHEVGHMEVYLSGETRAQCSGTRNMAVKKKSTARMESWASTYSGVRVLRCVCLC